uniref:DNA helicase n=1 Tax=Laurencia catarinensis TaxID=197326 RepID=UPI0028D1365B|nr:DNA helicase [Laurencia catarinensis]WMP12556.1 DNA helicase [Laurencia catarinensis]
MNQVYIQKFIPQNYLAEEILLGSIIIYPKLSIYVKNYIKKDFFFLESHTIIYINLTEQINKQFNIIQLIYLLKSKKLLKIIGGVRKIINIMRQSQIFINSSKISNYIEKLINILSSNYIKRLIIQYGYNMAKLGYISKINNEYLYTKLLSYLKFLEKEITKNQQKNKNITSIKKLISIKLLKFKNPIIYSDENKKINKSQIKIKFGIQKLDKITNGLPTGNLIIIAGRPSIGKTSFAIKIAYNVFFYQKSNICIFSLEMSTKEILDKFLCISCNINIGKSNTVKLKKENWKNILNICKKLVHNNIYINDRNNIKIKDIEHITKTLIRKQNLSLIIIDYLQLIGSISENNQRINRSQELGYITRRLKLLSQLLKLPIIVLSQLNRNIEIRSNKEPILSDLKESGCIKYIYNTNLDKHLNVKNINLVKLYIVNINSSNNDILYKYNKEYKHIKVIYFSVKTTLKVITHQSTLELTQNHKYLSGVSWKKVSISTPYSKINKKLIQFNNYKTIIDKTYMKQILINKPCTTYDINFNNKFHFLSNNTILHNSIEQDSDIIIMLNNKTEENNQIGEKTIDIKICKNRNGYTGYCEILFKPETMEFNEFSKNNKTKTSYIEQ